MLQANFELQTNYIWHGEFLYTTSIVINLISYLSFQTYESKREIVYIFFQIKPFSDSSWFFVITLLVAWLEISGFQHGGHQTCILLKRVHLTVTRDAFLPSLIQWRNYKLMILARFGCLSPFSLSRMLT